VESARFDWSGALGIGTPTPAYRLDVAGDINASGALRIGGVPVKSSQWTSLGSDIFFTGGKVGIGTTSPSQELQVQGNIAADYGSTLSASYRFGNGAENTGLSSPAPQVISFINNGVESARFDNFGRMGIGTFTPASSAQLELSSTTLGFLPPRMTLAQMNAIVSPANGLMVFCTDNNQCYVNKGSTGVPNWAVMSGYWLAAGSGINYNSGPVGIGQAFPVYPLNFGNTLGDKISFFGTTDDHYGIGIQPNKLQIHTDAGTSDITFGWGNSASFIESVRIKGTGQVGIGTATPGYPLDVNGSVNTTGLFLMNGVPINLSPWQHNGTKIFYNTGHVGIGESNPVYPLNFGYELGEKISLHGAGATHYGFGIQNYKMQIFTDASNSDIAFGYGSSATFTENVRMKGTGEVGIGTSSPVPSAVLDVTSTTKGFLPPRMTFIQRNAIVNPAEGLIVICTDCSAEGTTTMSMFLGGQWMNVCGTCTPPVSPAAGTQVTALTQITWNWNTVPIATGYKWNTTNNIATAVNMGTATTKTETGLNPETSFTRYVWAYNSCGNSAPTILTAQTVWVCGASFTVNHIKGLVAPDFKTVTYATVTNIPGEATKCWITSNLGASHQAVSVDDGTEPSAGWYWQFNRKQGYMHDGTNLSPVWNSTPINENSNWIAENDPCTLELGSVWRIPTEAEWTNILTAGSWTNWTGPWGSALKLHAAGRLEFSSGGMVVSRGSYGYYWGSSELTSTYGNMACYLRFFNSGNTIICGSKSDGNTLRCIR
jgi:hypothetical protein